jgi:hypothetical protein
MLRQVFAVKDDLIINHFILLFRILAPEILRGDTFSASTDMWQLGILVFFWYEKKAIFQLMFELFNLVFPAHIHFMVHKKKYFRKFLMGRLNIIHPNGMIYQLTDEYVYLLGRIFSLDGVVFFK